MCVCLCAYAYIFSFAHFNHCRYACSNFHVSYVYALFLCFMFM